jgi:hygromycin-B 7''-O-kinase
LLPLHVDLQQPRTLAGGRPGRHLPQGLRLTRRLFPEAPDLDAFVGVVRDDAVLAGGVARICDVLGVRARAERFPGGSRPVYALGDELVLKLYAPYDADEAARESAFLEVLHGRLPIATPKLHAVGALEGWSYVMMGRLRGELLVTAWPRIERAGQRELSRELGESLRTLHAIIDQRLERERVDFRALLQKQKETAVEQQQKRGLSEPWLEQIPEFLASEWPKLERAPAQAALHTEVMREHLFVEKRGEKWRISGLFDFEPAMIGAAEYEFAAIGVFVSCGDRELLREVLRGYGYAEGEMGPELERRFFAYALLHRYSNLTWYLSRLPPPAGAKRLEHLAAHFFGT